MPKSTRRHTLKLAAASLTAPLFSRAHAQETQITPPVTPGRLKQSIVHWCFARAAKWSVEDTCRAAKELGCVSVEGLGPEDWPILRKHGLTCAYTGVHGFIKGANNEAFHADIEARMLKRIDECAEAGMPTIITFTGMTDTSQDGGGKVSHEEGRQNCVKLFRKLMPHAEKKGITLVLEHLNSRVDEEMKGHPGYQGDDLNYCADIVREVASPRMKLLFDVYHVQIMHGDVIRRLEQNFDIIGHVHTAGNPGRGEIGPTQEINYPPIMKKLADLGYEGYVGQEFIPVSDPMASLREAVSLCTV